MLTRSIQEQISGEKLFKHKMSFIYSVTRVVLLDLLIQKVKSVFAREQIGNYFNSTKDNFFPLKLAI